MDAGWERAGWAVGGRCFEDETQTTSDVTHPEAPLYSNQGALCSIPALTLVSSGLQTVGTRRHMWLSASGCLGTFSLWQYLQIG